jgi:hypothetical protein
MTEGAEHLRHFLRLSMAQCDTPVGAEVGGGYQKSPSSVWCDWSPGEKGEGPHFRILIRQQELIDRLMEA